jgi:hypothetical protein
MIDANLTLGRPGGEVPTTGRGEEDPVDVRAGCGLPRASDGLWSHDSWYDLRSTATTSLTLLKDSIHRVQRQSKGEAHEQVHPPWRRKRGQTEFGIAAGSRM